jgi:ParB-like chromosome segregation protein Spo0J
MAGDHQMKRIPFSQIDFADSTYTLLPFADDQENPVLRDSIARAGLLHPPIIKENIDAAFQIVAGRKRLHILRDTFAVQDCTCIILPRDLDRMSAYTILFEETLLARPLTPVEKAVFFTNILQDIDVQQAARQFLPRLGLTPNPYHIERVMALLDLEEPLLIKLHQGILSEKTALELTRISFRDRMALYETIDQLQLSVGKQQQLLLACKELSARTRTAIADILSGPEVNGILNHPQANPPQKSTQLMAWLARQRFPRLSAAEQKFKSLTDSLELPPEAVLSHSLSFERDAITLALCFTNETDFLKTWQKIKTCFTNEPMPQ